MFADKPLSFATYRPRVKISEFISLDYFVTEFDAAAMQHLLIQCRVPVTVQLEHRFFPTRAQHPIRIWVCRAMKEKSKI